MRLGVPTTERRYTVEEYLRIEREAKERHEYRDGRILDMAGGTANHSLIITNVLAALHARLKGKPCRAYESNLRIHTPPSPLYTYPDLSIIWGPLRFDPNDSAGETVVNPRVIVEVLSPSTEGYDRGEKFTRYRLLESLEEYILVSQNTPRFDMFFRQSDGTWLFTASAGLEATARLRSVDVDLPLAEAYAGVEFPPQPAEDGKSRAV